MTVISSTVLPASGFLAAGAALARALAFAGAVSFGRRRGGWLSLGRSLGMDLEGGDGHGPRQQNAQHDLAQIPLRLRQAVW